MLKELERHKTGIALTAESPVSANPSASGYFYSIDKRVSGKYPEVYKIVNQEPYDVFDETDLYKFQMIATDGQYIAYSKVDWRRVHRHAFRLPFATLNSSGR